MAATEQTCFSYPGDDQKHYKHVILHSASWHVSAAVWPGSAPESVHCLPQVSVPSENRPALFTLEEAVKLNERSLIQVEKLDKLTSNL